VLTKKQKQVLDFLNTICPYGSSFCSLQFYNSKLICSMPFDEVSSVCDALQDGGYLRGLIISDTNRVTSLELTYKGRNRREFQRLNLLAILKEQGIVALLGAIAGVAGTLLVQILSR